MEIVLSACHAWNIILIGFKVPLYKVLFGLKETYILTELQGILLIPKCNLFRLRKTSPLAKPRANLFQITKTGTVSQDG